MSNIEGYWIGPYGVLIPNKLNGVISEDGYNIRYKTGYCTQRFYINPKPISAEIYQKKYAEYNNESGLWYYTGHKKNSDTDTDTYSDSDTSTDSDTNTDSEQNDNPGYWIGPHGVLVSNDIDSVITSDGYNTTYKNGGTSEIFRKNPRHITAEAYRKKYAKYDKESNAWYYSKYQCIIS